MRLRQVEVAGGSLQFLMAKQDLNGSKVGTGFQQMSSKAMPQRVRRNVLVNAGASSGGLYRQPDGFGS